MKKLFTAIFASLFLLTASGPAHAVPNYYTFTGTIGYTSDAGLALGDPLSYTMMIDFDVQGYISRYNGDTTVFF